MMSKIQVSVSTAQNALSFLPNVAYFNSIIIGFAPCHSTIILPGNMWQQESFQSPSVISNSG